MLENSVIQITTGKLMAASLLPSSVLLVSGIIIWRIWRSKQVRLQTETNELNDELRQMKKQMSDLQTAKTKASSDEVKPKAETSSSTEQQDPHESRKRPQNMGLFEYLIEDNVQLRQQAS